MTHSERRQATRLHISRHCQIDIHGQVLNARLEDLSEIGARLVLDQKPDIGAEIRLHLDRFGTLPGHVVRHTDDGIALYFDAATTMAAAFLQTIELEAESQSGPAPSQPAPA